MRAICLLLPLAGCAGSGPPARVQPTAALVAESRVAPLAARTTPVGVDVSLVSCELVRPVAIEQVLPDGSVYQMPQPVGRSAARLEVQVQNPGPDAIYLATCLGIPRVKVRHLPGWCSASDSETSVRLGPGEALPFYLTFKAAIPDHPLTDEVSFLIGNSPALERMTWTSASSPISFVVHSEGCGASVESPAM